MHLLVGLNDQRNERHNDDASGRHDFDQKTGEPPAVHGQEYLKVGVEFHLG